MAGVRHQPPQKRTLLQQAVLAYREEYLVEHCFGHLKGKPLSLTPMYLEDDRRATGLTRLLSIGLRVLTLLEHVARSHLAKQGEKLPGLYAGNPTRSTSRPTTEAMLRAFKNIALSVVTVEGQIYHHIAPLSKTAAENPCLAGLTRKHLHQPRQGFFKSTIIMSEPTVVIY